jgi:hypothetical protein
VFHCDAFVKRRIDSDLEILQAPTFALEPADLGAISRSSVIGTSRTRMPVACHTALATAPAPPVMLDLAHSLDAERVDMRIVLLDQDRFERGHVGTQRDVVLGQIGVRRTTGARVDDGPLVQRKGSDR